MKNSKTTNKIINSVNLDIFDEEYPMELIDQSLEEAGFDIKAIEADALKLFSEIFPADTFTVEGPKQAQLTWHRPSWINDDLSIQHATASSSKLNSFTLTNITTSGPYTATVSYKSDMSGEGLGRIICKWDVDIFYELGWCLLIKSSHFQTVEIELGNSSQGTYILTSNDLDGIDPTSIECEFTFTHQE